ncbi:copper resistance protein B [Pseudomonas massiliensis]|uniref:copper resistance protein B n=1 Tax=Pseudomonas massiliensis TaxID=522492 RepID=UPI00059169DA|nr:copper resistance protein B [Pseudomonas massiliensis]
MNKLAAMLCLGLWATGASAEEMPGMDHGAMPEMDHGAMKGMDHNAMPGMDHGAMKGMDHSAMPGAAHTGAASDPGAPAAPPRLPTPSDADRAAAFPDVQGHALADNDLHAYWLFDRLEYQKADEGTTLAWDAEGWVGADVDRLWLRTQGERTNGHTESAELQALYGHAVSPWWTLVGGVRQDFKPESPQTWAAFGIQGEPLADLDTEATLYLGENRQSSLRLEGDYDLPLTSSLILQPRMEANFFSRNDPVRQQGSGLSTLEAGLRLRYEIIPEIAPYVGVNWTKRYGRTADYAREEGDDAQEARLVVGVRLWY